MDSALGPAARLESLPPWPPKPAGPIGDLFRPIVPAEPLRQALLASPSLAVLVLVRQAEEVLALDEAGDQHGTVIHGIR